MVFKNIKDEWMRKIKKSQEYFRSQVYGKGREERKREGLNIGANI